MLTISSPPDRRDVFVSHASEDKDVIARPLADELLRRGNSVWFDEYELVLGDPLRQKIDEGLAESVIGVVILSHAFFAKRWPTRELEGFNARLMGGEKNVIVPVWHELDEQDLLRYSPLLAGLLAGNSANGVSMLADDIERVLARRTASSHRLELIPQAIPGVTMSATHATRPTVLTPAAPPEEDGGSAFADPYEEEKPRDTAEVVVTEELVDAGEYARPTMADRTQGPAPDPEPAAPARWPWPIAVGLVGAAAAALVLIARLGGELGGAHASTFRSGHLVLYADQQWHTDKVAAPGISLMAPVAISKGQTQLHAGTISKPGSVVAELPPALRSIYGAPAQSGVITLPLGRARRYLWPDPAEHPPLALVIVATGTGEVAIDCSTSSNIAFNSSLGVCMGILGKARIVGASVEYPGPDPSVGSKLSSALRPVEVIAPTTLTALLASRLTIRAQALKKLALAWATAANAVRAITSSPRYAEVIAQLSAALKSEAAMAARIAAAAQQGRRATYAALSSRFPGARSRVELSSRRLALMGFRLPSLARVNIAALPHVATVQHTAATVAATSTLPTPIVTTPSTPVPAPKPKPREETIETEGR